MPPPRPNQIDDLKRELIDGGGDIENLSQDGKRTTRLHRAAEIADVALVKLLVDLGANVLYCECMA